MGDSSVSAPSLCINCCQNVRTRQKLAGISFWLFLRTGKGSDIIGQNSRTIKVHGFPENRRKRGETVEEQIDLLSESAHIPVTFSSLVPIDYKRGDGT